MIQGFRRTGFDAGRGSLPAMVAAVLLAFTVACTGVDDTLPSTGDADATVDETETAPPETDDPGGADGDADAPDESAPEDGPEAEEPTDDGEDEGTDGGDEGPDTTPPEDDEIDPTEGGGGSGDDVAPLVLAFAFVGFGILLGAAIMWMVRRDDPDSRVGRDGHDWPDQEMSL